MPHIEIHQERAAGKQQELAALCPFGAIEFSDGKLSISAACKMCRLCIKKGNGVFEFVEDSLPGIDKSQWKGIAVVAEIEEGEIHPVTFELLGKAKELAAKVNYPVYCLMIGSGIDNAGTILDYGADEVFVYDQEELKYFRIEPYAAAVEDFINKVHPSSVLVGGTPAGRSLAPRVAARFRTGLTADCTKLDISENTDLDQIRPAYGGNIMAHINTPRHRPQFATVRYKIFSIPEKNPDHTGKKIHSCILPAESLKSGIEITKTQWKSQEKGIEEAEVLVVAGRGVKKAEDIAMLQELADLLGGKVASTRAVVEAGWVDAKCQIGLSGRTVKPKLLITCGVSGAIQFVAGMNSSEKIIAINTDENAPIFNVAHIGLKGDLYKIVPELIRQIKESRGEA